MQNQDAEHHQLINIYHESPKTYGKAIRRCEEREAAQCEWLPSNSTAPRSNSWKKNPTNKNSNYFLHKIPHTSHQLINIIA
jgi:hypothetical protein